MSDVGHGNGYGNAAASCRRQSNGRNQPVALPACELSH